MVLSRQYAEKCSLLLSRYWSSCGTEVVLQQNRPLHPTVLSNCSSQTTETAAQPSQFCSVHRPIDHPSRACAIFRSMNHACTLLLPFSHPRRPPERRVLCYTRLPLANGYGRGRGSALLANEKFGVIFTLTSSPPFVLKGVAGTTRKRPPRKRPCVRHQKLST